MSSKTHIFGFPGGNGLFILFSQKPTWTLSFTPCGRNGEQKMILKPLITLRNGERKMMTLGYQWFAFRELLVNPLPDEEEEPWRFPCLDGSLIKFSQCPNV